MGTEIEYAYLCATRRVAHARCLHAPACKHAAPHTTPWWYLHGIRDTIVTSRAPSRVHVSKTLHAVCLRHAPACTLRMHTRFLPAYHAVVACMPGIRYNRRHHISTGTPYPVCWIWLAHCECTSATSRAPVSTSMHLLHLAPRGSARNHSCIPLCTGLHTLLRTFVQS